MSFFLRLDNEKYNAAISVLDRLDDRSCILVAASLLEKILLETIETRFRNRNDKVEASVCKGYGPLASFRAKIDFAYLLGLYNESGHKNLSRIKSVRNLMAHEISPLAFSSSEIIDHLNNLPTPRDLCLSWKRSSDWFQNKAAMSDEDKAEASRIIAGIAGPAAASEDTPRQRFLLYIRQRIIALNLAAQDDGRGDTVEFLSRDHL